MQYRLDKKSGNKLSSLGFGCLRLPASATKAEEVIMDAFKNGVNFFDTAYLYPGSEAALGKVLHDNKVREKVYIATKLPQIKCNKYDDFDKIFNVQLERLKTTYIDYYLMHNLSKLSDWELLCGLGIEKWIEEKKSQGKIRQLGFSFHGTKDEFSKLVDACDWDFCMIQYNYINTNYQAGIAGLKYANSKGMPVFVMEPLLGGRLSDKLPDDAVKVLKQHNKNASPTSWALRWLWNQPEVTMVLSGMNELAHVKENVSLAETKVGSMSEEELEVIDRVVDIFSESYKIPCTSCNYCLPCPVKINIPDYFAAYNASFIIGFGAGLAQYATAIGAASKEPVSASHCTKCGKCVKVCPQEIAIPDRLEDVRRRMEPLWFRAVISVVRRFMT